jgi:hypothetical protein
MVLPIKPLIQGGGIPAPTITTSVSARISRSAVIFTIFAARLEVQSSCILLGVVYLLYLESLILIRMHPMKLSVRGAGILLCGESPGIGIPASGGRHQLALHS